MNTVWSLFDDTHTFDGSGTLVDGNGFDHVPLTRRS